MVSFNEDCFHKCFKSAKDSTRDSHTFDSINNSRSFNKHSIKESKNILKSCEEAVEDYDSPNEEEQFECKPNGVNNHSAKLDSNDNFETNDQELFEKREMLKHESEKLDQIFDKNVHYNQLRWRNFVRI